MSAPTESEMEVFHKLWDKLLVHTEDEALTLFTSHNDDRDSGEVVVHSSRPEDLQPRQLPDGWENPESYIVKLSTLRKQNERALEELRREYEPFRSGNIQPSQEHTRYFSTEVGKLLKEHSNIMLETGYFLQAVQDWMARNEKELTQKTPKLYNSLQETLEEYKL